jgi:hypothetical protein
LLLIRQKAAAGLGKSATASCMGMICSPQLTLIEGAR